MDTFQLGQIEVRGLPRRQAETLAHTALGLSAKETAREMAISPRTVEMNLALAMEKLRARNRVHLITRAFARGVIAVKEGALSLFLLLSLSATSTGDVDWNRLSVRGCRGRREEICLCESARAAA